MRHAAEAYGSSTAAWAQEHVPWQSLPHPARHLVPPPAAPAAGGGRRRDPDGGRHGGGSGAGLLLSLGSLSGRGAGRDRRRRRGPGDALAGGRSVHGEGCSLGEWGAVVTIPHPAGPCRFQRPQLLNSPIAEARSGAAPVRTVALAVSGRGDPALQAALISERRSGAAGAAPGSPELRLGSTPRAGAFAIRRSAHAAPGAGARATAGP